MACTVCLRDKKIAAKGLCKACYQRKLKRGTTDYAPVRVRGVCSVKGCDRPHAARGFCYLHYERVLTCGDPEQTKRPDDWGAKGSHPLRHSWWHMMRHKLTSPVAEEWNDFLQFVTDVGERPCAGAKLFSADETKPLGPDNFVWKQAYTQRVDGEDEQTFTNRRARAYRRVKPEQYAEYAVKSNYGLSESQRDAMNDLQGGLCVICLRPETSERYKRLAVDHCHKSGKIRGLLCNACNRALGGFKDDPDRLRRALIYLTGSTPVPK